MCFGLMINVDDVAHAIFSCFKVYGSFVRPLSLLCLSPFIVLSIFCSNSLNRIIMFHEYFVYFVYIATMTSPGRFFDRTLKYTCIFETPVALMTSIISSVASSLFRIDQINQKPRGNRRKILCYLFF